MRPMSKIVHNLGTTYRGQQRSAAPLACPPEFFVGLRQEGPSAARAPAKSAGEWSCPGNPGGHAVAWPRGPSISSRERPPSSGERREVFGVVSVITDGPSRQGPLLSGPSTPSDAFRHWPTFCYSDRAFRHRVSCLVRCSTCPDVISRAPGSPQPDAQKDVSESPPIAF